MTPMQRNPVFIAIRALYISVLAIFLINPAAQAAQPAAGGWRQCAALAADSQARLACYDGWAQAQAQAQAWQAPPATASAQAALGAAPAAAAPAAEQDAPTAALAAPAADNCRDGLASTLSRFWELERTSDCGALRFRGYRPISVSVVGANTVNRQPTSDNPENNASSPIAYRRTEMRVQLSVRTKLAKGLLTPKDSDRLDSLWAGYTQQSYWQLFSPDISRPFRNTDHEPELVYVYPTDYLLPLGWRLRYAGVGLVHQSNGQSRPLSRSWNRTYLMAGMELHDRWIATARIWKRLSEDPENDDNPGISDYIGRAELGLAWQPDRDNLLQLTARHALASHGRGSLRLEWLQPLGSSLAGPRSNLRLHTQLFSGYGDSLIDYNRRRTVFSIGLSLVDF